MYHVVAAAVLAMSSLLEELAVSFGDIDMEEDAVDTIPKEAWLSLHLCSALFLPACILQPVAGCLFLGLCFLSLFFGCIDHALTFNSHILYLLCAVCCACPTMCCKGKR